MRNYAPYLLYQVARFGALNVQQMLTICDGKCKRSSMYRAINELIAAKHVRPIQAAASRTRGYFASRDGRKYSFGGGNTAVMGVRACDLDHTIQVADVLMELCRFEGVTGISTPFELSPEDVSQFCHNRVPDGIFRLTQNDQDFEIALEVERVSKEKGRVSMILENYWQTFKYGMECSGLLIVAMDETIFNRYTKSIATMPQEFQNRVRIVQGIGLTGLPPEAYGKRGASIHRCMEINRTKFHGEISYVPVKSNIYLPIGACSTLQVPGGSQEQV